MEVAVAQSRLPHRQSQLVQRQALLHSHHKRQRDDFQVQPALVPGLDLVEAVRLVGDDLHALTAADSLYLLRGTTHQMADQIQHRRDIFGYSYITVNELYLEQFAPVVELLHGA